MLLLCYKMAVVEFSHVQIKIVDFSEKLFPRLVKTIGDEEGMTSNFVK